MKLPIYALLGITTLGFACGPDSEKEGEKIETSQVHAIVAQNTGNAISTTLTNADFLENSDLIEKLFGAAAGQTCIPVAVDENGGSLPEPECSPRELNLDFGELNVSKDDLSQYLQSTIFHADTVESTTDTEITYLVDGETICGEDDPMFPSSCVTDLNKAEIRLRVTSPETNAVKVDVLVGPGRDNPFSAEFHSDELAVEADLDGIEGAIGYLQSQSVIDNDIDIPTTFDGRLRAQINVDGPKKVSASLSVLRDINVAGGDFGLQVGANEPSLQVTLDGELEVLSILADVGQTKLRFQDGGQTFEFDIAGIDGQAALYAGSDSIIFADIGLGDAQSTLKIDGTQALSFDFNADSGRHIDFVASADTNGVKLDFADSLKMALGLSFDDAEAPAYVQDDVLNVSLEGANPSIIAKNGEILEILEGTFKASLEKAGDSIEAKAGQCMAPFAETDADGSDANLIEDMAVVACE